MRSINMHQVRGNVGSVDFRQTTDGTPVINLSVATNDVYIDPATGEVVTRTDWHRAAAFGKFAERINKIARVGDYVFLSGPVKRGKYVKDGVEIPTAEIRLAGQAADFQLIARKGERMSVSEEVQNPTADEPADTFEEDEVPF